MVRKSVSVLALCVAFAALPALADANQEIATAAAHAGMAAGADTTKTLHFHIQHTLNCLEGKSGPDFSAGTGNPCDEQGQGAIPDSAPAARAALQQAVAKAKLALAEQDFEKGKAAAAEAQLILSK